MSHHIWARNSINAIPDIPGLHISDLMPALEPASLKSQGFTHVLSLIDAQNAPKPDPAVDVVYENIAIEDYDLVDLLEHIEGLCDWVEGVLAGKEVRATAVSARPEDVVGEEQGSTGEEDVKVEGKVETAREPRVLVHCFQGVSRSGSVVVALLMRRLGLSFDEALERARESRPIIMPNPGFADQLRVWEEVGFSIYEEREKEGEEGGKVKERVLKKRYTEWKENRGVLMSRSEEEGVRATRRGVAALAARIGALRMEEKDGDEK
ncbi:phosphatases II [Polyplosphaeria fusca]|uniref:protein-tyrosine-phosphatase n=1 Tax=Polyplosphaeria fusca TaxID=682080 RepID=A0A9P4R6E8_9PLEO|nr:phosphatases II [Polyplosphaeria fusca]